MDAASASGRDLLRAPAAARWEGAARLFFLLAAMGSVSSPPVANIGAALGLLALCGVRGMGARLRAALRTPLGVGILVLLAALGLAMLWADGVPWPQRFASWWSWRPLVLLLVGTALFDTARARDAFARGMVVFLAVAAAASFILYAIPGAIVIDEPGILLRNHVTQGMAFVAGAALAVMLAWGRPAAPGARWARWALSCAAVLFVANIATITSGRSAHVALLVVVALGAFQALRGRLRWPVLAPVLILVPVLCAGLLAASPMVRHRFEAVVTEVDTVDTSPVATSSGIRLVIWSTTGRMIARRPWLGYGMGGFVGAYDRAVHEQVLDTDNWRDASRAKDTHNEYLHVLVEAGIPGLLAFFAFAAGVLRQPAPAPYRACALALFLAWMATSLFNSHFQTFAEAHLLGLLLGALLGIEREPQSGASSARASAATSS
jgi:O-antigen ligase